MAARNEVQQAFENAGKSAGYKKKRASTWYKSQDGTLAVLNLQRSLYGPSYYVNLGLWILPRDDASFPRDETCQVRARVEDLVAPEQHGRLASLLDLEKDIDGPTRITELERFIVKAAEEFASFPTVESLVSKEGGEFLGKVMVDGRGSEALRRVASETKFPGAVMTGNRVSLF